MKVEVEKKVKPIIITLETQEDIDLFATIFNHIQIVDSLEMRDRHCYSVLRSILSGCKSENYYELHNKLTKEFNKHK